MKTALRKSAFREIKGSLSRFLSIFGIVAIGVGFFSGVKTAAPDMRNTADSYFDNNSLMDYRLVSTYGFDEKDIEALRKIEGAEVYPSYYTDVVVSSPDSPSSAARFYSMGYDDSLNTIILEEGRLPEKPDECIICVSDMKGGPKVGSRITLRDDKGQPPEDILTISEYTVVGSFMSPMYIDKTARGSTSVGNGSINAVYLIPEENFCVEYNTQVYIRFPELDGYNCYEDEYKDRIKELTDVIENISEERKEGRYADIITEANEELDKAKKEVADAEKEADEKIADGEREIEDAKQKLSDAEKDIAEAEKEIADNEQKLIDGKQELTDGRKEYEDGVKELEDAKEEYKKEIEKAEKEIADGYKEIEEKEKDLAEGEKEYNDGLEKYNKGLADYNEGYEEFQKGKDEFLKAEEEYNANLALIESGKKELSEAKKTLDETKAKLDMLKAYYGETEEYKLGLMQYEAGLAQYEAKLAELNAAEEQLKAGEAELSAAREKIEASEIELSEAKNTLDESKKQLDEAEAQLAEGREKLNEGKKELSDGEKELAEKKAEAEKEFADAEKELADAKLKLDDGDAEILDGERQLTEGKEKLEQGKKDYEQGLIDLEKGEKELADGKAEAEEKLSDAKEKLKDAEEEIADLEKPKWYIFTREDNPGYSEYGENAQRINNIAAVFPVFFILVAVLVCLTTMSRMVEEQRVQIGTYKALGYSNGDIIFKYMLYAVTATVTGAVVGVLVGMNLLPYVIITAYGIMYDIPGLILYIDMVTALISTGVFAAAVILVVILSCKSALSEQSAQLMRPKAPKTGKRIFLERVKFFWNRLSFSGKVTARNIFRYKRKMFMSVVGIAGCTALLLTGFALYDSINDIIVLQYTELQHYQGIAVYDSESYPESGNKAAEVISGYGDSVKVFQKMMTVSSGDRNVKAYIAVPDDAEKFTKFLTLRNRRTKEPYALTDGEVLMDEKMSMLLGDVACGDTVEIGKSDTEKFDMTVSGIFENYPNHYVYMTPSTYESVFGEKPEYNALYFTHSLGKEDENGIAEKILETDGVVTVTFNSDVEESFSKMLGSLNMVILVIIAAAGLLAFVVMYNLTNINITERIREIATLKVLGFYDGEVDSYIFRENIILSLFGTAVGLVLGIFLANFVITTAEVDLVMFGRNIYPLSYVLAAIVTMLFSAMVTLVMHKRLKNVDMIESLKSVE